MKGEDISSIIEENLLKGGNSQPKLVIMIKKWEGLQKWNIHFEEPTDLLNIKSMQHDTHHTPNLNLHQTPLASQSFVKVIGNFIS